MRNAFAGQRTGSVLGLGAACLTVVAWGFSAIFGLLVSLDGLSLAAYRLWTGAAVMVVVLLATRRRLTWSALRVSLPGGLCFAGDLTMFFCAIKLTSVVDVTLIGALQPALVLLVAGPWFGERVGAREIVWTAIAIAGVALVVVASGGTGGRTLAGDLLAVGALLAWTGYWLASKHARRTLDTLEYLGAVALIGAAAIVPILLVARHPLPRVPADGWLWLGLLVLISGFFGHGLMNWAHRFVDVSVSSVLVVGVPVVAAAAALVFLGEALRPVQWVGGAIAVGAIAGIVLRPGRPDVPEPV